MSISEQELRDLPVLINMGTACKVLDISENHGYTLARRGEFPARVVRLGGAVRVQTADLRALILGDPTAGDVA